MTQQQLDDMFTAGEKARKLGLPLDNGWGSNRHIDKDSLWDSNTDTHWSRDHPDGLWVKVPALGSDHA